MSLLSQARPRSRAALVASVAAVAAVLSMAAPVLAHPAAGAEADGPMYQAPKVGECRQLTNAALEAGSDPTAPIDCAASHNSLTIAVFEVPEGFEFPAESQGAALDDALATECAPAFKELLGRSWKVIARSAYHYSWFAPTDDQLAHGARWIRCDVNLSGARKPVALRADLTLPTHLPRALRTCYQVSRSSIEGVRSSCGDRFNFRYDAVFKVPGSTYPTREKWLRFGQAHCPAVERGTRWWSSWGGASIWQAGNHYLVCYRPA